MKIFKHVIVSLLFFGCISGQADEASKFALPLSASLGLGTMESSELGLKSRVMNGLSIDALPSYRFQKWLFGPHLDLRLQGQTTSVSDSGGTNLKGSGWLVGAGARLDCTERFFVQGAIDFLGAYDFTKNTSQAKDDSIHSPLGLRIKTGYVYFEKIPNLTLDADLQYLTYSTIRISGSDQSKKLNQLMASVGVTYQFEFGKEKTVPESAAASEPVPAPAAPREDLAKMEGVEKVGQSLRLNVAGASFESGSANLSEGAKAQFTQAAQAIAKSDSNVRVEGYTDSSGRLVQNKTLSQARAESVKAFLIENGVKSEKVSAQGFGPAKPIADNKTKEGRAKNRRVEIYIDETEGGQK